MYDDDWIEENGFTVAEVLAKNAGTEGSQDLDDGFRDVCRLLDQLENGTLIGFGRKNSAVAAYMAIPVTAWKFFQYIPDENIGGMGKMTIDPHP